MTINLRHPRGRTLFERLVAESDVVTENFASGVLARLGYSYDELRTIKPDIIYASNCGFGHTGPYASFKTWGPVVQALCGLTFSSGLPDMPPAGLGYSYMDHHGANFMAIAILAALLRRQATGEGAWIDMACVEAGAAMLGPSLLDWSVNGRPLRRDGQPHSNRSSTPDMAPHGIYPSSGVDEWIALGCRHDDDWARLAQVVAQPWAQEPRWATSEGRLGAQDELDERLSAWTRGHERYALARRLQDVGVPAAAVAQPGERIDHDANTAEWGLWPTVIHREIGKVRVDGLPIHLSETDWSITEATPCLGEHNAEVFQGLLGVSDGELEALRSEGAI